MLISSIFLMLFASAGIAFARSSIFVADYFEQRCNPEKGFVTESFENWIANLTDGSPLYFPLLSKLDALRITQDLFKKSDLTFLSEDDVLNSCITVRASGSKLTFNGYCGQSATKKLIPVANKILRWNQIFPGGVGGLFRISLSDGKSWQIVDVCWSDGQRSFAVISLQPYLSSCTQRVIREHLKAIGFQEKFFSEIKYNVENCKVPCRRIPTDAI